MKVEYTALYAEHVSAIASLLSDEAFLGEYASELGATSHDVEVVQRQDSCTTLMHMIVPTAGIPDPFRRFVGSTLRVTDERMYDAPTDDGVRRGQFNVRTEAGRARVVVDGVVTLSPEGGGCRFSATGDLRVKLPLFAEQAARLLKGLAIAGLEDQTKVVNRWLSAERL
jgi:hypothetical protein